MKKQIHLCMAIATTSILFASCTGATPPPSQPTTPPVVEKEVKKEMITLSKTTFQSNEDITISYTVDPTISKNAWIGIIPSETAHGSESTNDQYDVSYQYLSGSTAGTKVFVAPAKPGKYDFRLSDGGKELYSTSFTVEAGVGANIKPAITLTKTKYAPGEALVGEFTAPSTLPKDAWIGVIPSTVAHGSEATNDASDLSYQYTSGKTQGKIELSAPTVKGSYDLRMNESDSSGANAKEIATITFTVE